MASHEVEIFRSVKRFSDYTKDTIVANVVLSLRELRINDNDIKNVVKTIETTFEQCNFNGAKEIEAAVKNSLN